MMRETTGNEDQEKWREFREKRLPAALTSHPQRHDVQRRPWEYVVRVYASECVCVSVLRSSDSRLCVHSLVCSFF